MTLHGDLDEKLGDLEDRVTDYFVLLFFCLLIFSALDDLIEGFLSELVVDLVLVDVD